MPVYCYNIHVEAETKDQADQVIAERIDYSEDYGFPYHIYKAF